MENTKQIKDINEYCKMVGLIFIGLGVLHIILSSFLSAWWGGLLIILGIISVSYRKRVIILVVGITLIIVGLLNISILIYEVNTFWLILGVFQIIWGIQELKRYSRGLEK